MIIQMHNKHFYANFKNNSKAAVTQWSFCRLKRVVPVCHIQSVHGLLILRSLKSDEVEALDVFDGMQQFLFQCLLISVLGQIQQVEACVRYREILLSATGGLDH